MCEFCIKHGEGEKWYLNVKNYSQDLLSDINRRRFTENFFYWVNRSYKGYFHLLKLLPVTVPIIGPTLKAIIKHFFIYEHWGQVIPIEDVEKVLSFTNSITRVPCICRKVTTDKEIRSCFLISLDPKAFGIEKLVDQSFFGGPSLARFEKFTAGDALNFMKDAERKGAVHTIWTLKAPFIGALCTCDDTGCIAIKAYREITPIFFKAEYVINITKDNCVGCKKCIKICLFKALEYDSNGKQVKIDYKKCHGCGVCRTVCENGALFLQDRSLITKVAHIW